MLFVMRVLELMGLSVKKPVMLYVDNKGAKDLANNWSVGGRTRHLKVGQYFLRELKEQGIINCVWVAGATMSSDLFTKNLPRQVYEKHTKIYVGDDEYMNKRKMSWKHQGVRREMTPRWYSDVHKIHNDQDSIKNSKEVYGR
jgi:tRNA G18 (ribose-2'-O)-methylase SpoU